MPLGRKPEAALKADIDRVRRSAVPTIRFLFLTRTCGPIDTGMATHGSDPSSVDG